MNLSEITAPLQGILQGADTTFHSVSTDTRTLKPGDLFIAIKGPNFNGNAFIAEAEKKGAAAAIVSEMVSSQIPLLQVADTRIALGKLAHFYRQKFSLPLIALTGSCGKTTTKAMLASILQNCGSTLATAGTLNNDFGVPLTLLGLGPEHQFAVIEMGANHAGEIAYVAEIAKPTVALITNAAAAHLEGFGDLPGVAKAKGEIFQALGDNGIAIINADDQFAQYWQELAEPRQIIRFGRNSEADVTAKNIRIDEKGFAVFDLITPQGEINIQLHIMGEHNVANALAAAAAAQAVGASLNAIKKGLEMAQPVYQRLVVHHTPTGACIIDDSYNANPLSVKAAIEILAQKPGEKILALGDMRELGANAKHYHEEIGREAKRLGINRLYGFGELSEYAVQGFGEQGYHFADQNILIAALDSHLQSQASANISVLVKGSKSMKMNRVVNALIEGKKSC